MCDGMQATFNSLFLGYVKNGRIEDLRKAIAAMKEREIMPTNLSLQSIISGFVEYQQLDDVLTYLPDLKVRNMPTTHCWLQQTLSNPLLLFVGDELSE